MRRTACIFGTPFLIAALLSIPQSAFGQTTGGSGSKTDAGKVAESSLQKTLDTPAGDRTGAGGPAKTGDAAGQPKPAQLDCDGDCRLNSRLYIDLSTGSPDQLKQELSKAAEQNNLSKFTLVLDDTVMDGISPKLSDKPDKYFFELKRFGTSAKGQADNRAAWDELLAHLTTRDVHISVAESGVAQHYLVGEIQFSGGPDGLGGALLALVAILAAGFVWLAVKSDILRDAPSVAGGPKMSFSLGRCQMAWWTFIVLLSFVSIWAVTGDWDVVPQGALILMGISAATAMGAGLVDSNRKDERQGLTSERDTLKTRLDQLALALKGPTPPNASDLQAERDQKQKRLTEIENQLGQMPTPPSPTEGFVFDILRDETGISLHRFQMAMWTLVLGLVFISEVFKHRAMPDFSTTLLTLMGISSGTYVGFKLPDPPKAPNQDSNSKV